MIALHSPLTGSHHPSFFPRTLKTCLFFFLACCYSLIVSTLLSVSLQLFLQGICLECIGEYLEWKITFVGTVRKAWCFIPQRTLIDVRTFRPCELLLENIFRSIFFLNTRGRQPLTDLKQGKTTSGFGVDITQTIIKSDLNKVEVIWVTEE